ncbi:hypothetical protein [Halolamina rubra]|uniref:hypothetical protein n=1 Tax=Halolamina rubra TaxID=1380430 RepID=UPI000679844A|nr:hypothetical protein [Halolamina rubra]
MTAEVDWVLEQFESVVDAQPDSHPLYRVDRDQSHVYETGEDLDMQTPIRERTGELKKANYVGVSHADTSTSPIGTEFDLEVERIVSVRVEGLHHSEWGHVDPAGYGGGGYGAGGYGVNLGARFDDATGLVADLQAALWTERQWPNVPRDGTEYTHLLVRDYGPRLDEYGDYYRYDFEVLFDGFEDLP